MGIRLVCPHCGYEFTITQQNYDIQMRDYHNIMCENRDCEREFGQGTDPPVVKRPKPIWSEHIECQECNGLIKYDLHYTGKRLSCPYCGEDLDRG